MPNLDGIGTDDESAVTPRIDRRGVLRGLLAGTTLVGGTSVTAAAAGSDDGFSTEVVAVDSFDGTTLAGTLFEPASDGPHPAVLMTHGWGEDRQIDYVRRMAELYVRNDYVVLAYDSRGFGESEGQVGLDGPNEVGDARHLLTWLAGRDAVQTVDGEPDNPVVGMDSLSYAGGIQLNVAAVEDRLDAVIPRWAWSDLVYSMAPNGVVKSGWATLLYTTGATGSRGVTSGDGIPDEHDAREGLPPELHEIYATATTENRLSEDGKAYLRERSPGTKLDAIDTPTLLMQGWPDTLFVPNEALWTYRGLREHGVETRLLLFHGGHTTTDTSGPEQIDHIDAAALQWMETHVRRDETTDRPPVTYYDGQADSWKSANGLPPSGGSTRTLTLRDAENRGSGSTVIVNSAAPTSTSHLLPANYDLSDATAADFDFPVKESMELLGPARIRLAVEPFGSEARLFVKLWHVRGGEATLISNQVTPFRVDGSELTPVDVEGVAIQRRFEPGDTLRVTVAATDAGFYASRESPGARIHHSALTPSRVGLPVRR